MDRWRLVVHHLNRPTMTHLFEDVYALGNFQRANSAKVWRMEIPERLHGPAMSADEAAQGYVIGRQGDEWTVYERAS